ncbi:peptidylprolyl isomerase [bacterium]
MTVQEKRIVSLHYKLTDDKDATLDSSEGQEPLTYMHGTNSLIPGLEKQLTGKTAGDEIQVTVQPEEAYGQFNSNLVQKVPHDAFKEIGKVEPGMELQSTDPDGHVQLLIVQEVDEQGVTVNGNHPLAGQTLHFDVKIEEVREATEEEMNHGHAH